jgi:hypothetical protein
MTDSPRVRAAIKAAEESLRVCGPGARAISEAIAAAFRAYDAAPNEASDDRNLREHEDIARTRRPPLHCSACGSPLRANGPGVAASSRLDSSLSPQKDPQ